ncbi:rRNA-processing protein fcf2 [Gracilariopsis chorda]|uniref:rRNA-processing protein fcf2 n=1 Tax=Gracilariopsis chorda TaxID=448386 RepID=A0A2V3IIH3_9FLOR|nr:rRNA-processing protein fcf2 [Gracilariopsis chorda]|eukprot:PXF41905.1 rRNA-processing protein fcf2 [Gracilariopsis chorda]
MAYTAMNNESSPLVNLNGLKLPTTKLLYQESQLDRQQKLVGQELHFLNRSTERRSRKTPQQVPPANWAEIEHDLKEAKPPPSVQTTFIEDDHWHEMPAANLTPELQRDLRIIENRQHLDPKRFYKSSGTGRKKGQLPTHVQVGTVLSGAHEFFSGRLLKRERRARIIDQVLASKETMHYTKSRYQKLQSDRMANRRIVDPAAMKKRRRRKW